jgi:hypothetical protein
LDFEYWLQLQVTDIPCGTKGGVMITFGKIEVITSIIVVRNIWFTSFYFFTPLIVNAVTLFF